jgi:hypothetical protein
VRTGGSYTPSVAPRTQGWTPSPPARRSCWQTPYEVRRDSGTAAPAALYFAGRKAAARDDAAERGQHDQSEYTGWDTLGIYPKGHGRRHNRDSLGRVTQVIEYVGTNPVALLAETIHTLAGASTAKPL